MNNIIRSIDKKLNNITMYRLILYGLSALILLSLIFAFTGVLSLSPVGLLLTLALVSLGGFLANQALAKIWRVPLNFESEIITALILYFILPPTDSVERGALVFLAGVLAMASKFFLVRRRAHIFNPAAFAAAALGLTGLLYASWWVGSSALWPFVLLLGLLVVRKIRRFPMFLTFAGVALLMVVLVAIARQQSAGEAVSLAITSSPLIFLGTIMLTEPLTMPARRGQQIIFAAIVGGLYALHPSAGSFYVSPEIALLAGNLYVAVANPRQRIKMTLKEVQRISDKVANYVFTPDMPVQYKAGQYMEWTLPPKGADSRGNRRTFTIASSPTEETVQLGVKFYEPSSSFKKRLRELKPGQYLYAGQVAGDFTLPADKAEKLIFIAGGIGITPFRSMLKQLIDSGETRDIILIYLLANAAEQAYRDVLDAAGKHGVKVRVITGAFSPELLSKAAPDFASRHFYLSGPRAMVDGIRGQLTTKGVSRSRITSDYFSGY